VILRGHWTATIDDVDAGNSPAPGDLAHLRALARMLGDHQRRRLTGAGRLLMDSRLGAGDRLADRLLQAAKHQVRRTR